MNNLFFWLSRKINYLLIPPPILQISLTYRCNLKCKMCSIAGLLPETEELSTKQILHIIDEAKSYGVHEVILTGGEPFLYHDIFDICDYIAQKKLRSIITTNAALIDINLAKKISHSKIDHLHISLDGLEENNDYFRGGGTFKKICVAIGLLNQQRNNGRHFSMGIACTVMNNNINDLYSIVKLADDLNIDVINFQPLVKDNANFLDKTLPRFWVNSQSIPLLVEQIEKIRNAKYRHISIYEEPPLELLASYYKGMLTRKEWVCFGGFKTVFICFEKNQPLVYSCHGICGNLDKISLKKAWTSKEAYALRKHSRSCKNLCLQSCYSRYAAQSLKNLLRFYFKKI